MANIFDKWVEEEERRYEKFCEREDDFFREVKELAFTFLKGIRDSKLAKPLKRNFILENRYRGSGVSISRTGKNHLFHELTILQRSTSKP